MSRISKSLSVEYVSTERPFSNFEYVDKHFEGSFPIRRLFSQARSRGYCTLINERVPCEGIVLDENEEIRSHFPDYECREVRRISFWKIKVLSEPEIEELSDDQCIGYAILKHDRVSSENKDDWHVFESVIVKYDHPHNFYPCRSEWEFAVKNRTFRVRGSLYCQQNGLNKACAQVALRSACATYLNFPDLSYSKINDLAYAGETAKTPCSGLTTKQIAKVLKGLEIPHFHFNYGSPPDSEHEWRDLIPYPRLLYTAIESGAGAMLAFTMSGPAADTVGHIIPFFGHTFNEDAWPAVAEGDYFRVGETIRYLTSDAWMSSFIVHDDNFGSNLCIPKAYLSKYNVQYVVGLIPKGFCSSGIFAEIAGANYFYTILDQLPVEENVWLRRLKGAVIQKKLILRTLAVSGGEYLEHLSTIDDWNGRSEDRTNVENLKELIDETDSIWMVEVSIPDLFSTNKAKVGELLLDGSKEFGEKFDYSLFILARFPGCYLFLKDATPENPVFSTAGSRIGSHTPVLKRG